MIKYFKRFVSFTLTAVLLCACVCTAHAAGSYFQKDGFYFGIQDGEAYIHGTDGTGWDIVIPERFLDYYVTAIEEYAFYENQSIEVLSFYEASQLNRIGAGAFARCPKLKKVHITETIQEMGTGAFEDCTALSYVRFRDGALTDVPAQSFYGCSALKMVVFDNEITRIGSLAFAGCTALTQLELPDTVTEIADNAFAGCDDLVIYCTKESYALRYAITNGVEYVITNPDPDPQPAAFMKGDADGDGEVTILDATAIQRWLAGLSVSSFNERAALITSDTINILDATVIQRYIAGFMDPYSIGEIVSSDVE